MNAADEKFFESLAGTKPGADKNYGVEFARADASAIAPRTRPAPAARTEPKETGWPDDDGPEGQLTVDVYQTPTDIVVESAIAGVKPDDIDINVTPDSISIKGSRRREKTLEEKDYLYQECYWGRFARSIILPQEVDPENADVVFKGGILTVRLPKANKRKSRKLSVRME